MEARVGTETAQRGPSFGRPFGGPFGGPFGASFGAGSRHSEARDGEGVRDGLPLQRRALGGLFQVPRLAMGVDNSVSVYFL